MKKSELFLIFIQVPLDFIALIFAGIAAHSLRFSEFFVRLRAPQFSFEPAFYFSLISLVALTWIALFAFSGLYTINPNRKLASDITKIIYASTTGLAIITIYIFFKGDFFNSRFIVLAAWIFAMIFVCATHLLTRAIKIIMYRMEIGLRNTIVIGSNGTVSNLVDFLKTKKSLGYNVLEYFSEFNGRYETKMNELHNSSGIDEVILATTKIDNEEALSLIDWCAGNHVIFKYSADFFATLSTNTAVYTLAGLPIIEVRKTRLEGWGRIIKGIVDFIGAIVLIVIFSPFMIVAAAAIFVETGKPIIYKNERMGRAGKKFNLYKFRSMHKKYSIGPQFGSAEEQKNALEFEQALIKKQSIKEGPLYKIKNDPRITKVGKFIRRWSVDELPQFFNVLMGDMSLIGPRPHQRREVEKYQKHHKAVLNIKPGITGMGQISGRSDLEFEEEVRLDTFYMERWSLFLDLIILLKTPFVVLKKTKAS